MKKDYEVYEKRMTQRIETLSSELTTIRAGRANAAVLDKLHIDYFGTPTPIQQVASVSTPDPRTLVISPWDASTLKPIEKAILTSDLGINPTNDGKVIRLSFPQLNEERRKELTKLVAKYTEEAKISIRGIRRDAIDAFKAAKKKSEITEDDLKICEKDLQELTDKFCKEADAVAQKKDKELLEV